MPAIGGPLSLIAGAFAAWASASPYTEGPAELRRRRLGFGLAGSQMRFCNATGTLLPSRAFNFQRDRTRSPCLGRTLKKPNNGVMRMANEPGNKPQGGTSSRGFASMDQAKQREIARKGGESVPNEKRSFSQNRELASQAGRKGGEARGNRVRAAQAAQAAQANQQANAPRPTQPPAAR